MSIVIKRKYIIAFMAAFLMGCTGAEGGGAFADSGGGSSGATPPSAVPVVAINKPSPCMRVQGTLEVSVSASDDKGVAVIYILLNNVVKAILTAQPYFVAISLANLPADGSYNLEAIVYDGDNNFSSDAIEIRLDNAPPFQNNYLVVDSDADPLGLGAAYGAVFRINTGTGKVCPIASSTQFVDPVSVVIEPDETIVISDELADLNGAALPGSGALFRLDPKVYNSVTPVITHSDFRKPAGIDVSGSTIYMADSEANPSGIPVGQGETAPGAVFAINRTTSAVATVATDAVFETPVGVLREPNGAMYIADADADPLLSGFPKGAVFYYSGGPVTAAANTFFNNPYDMAEDLSGKIMLTDSGDVTMARDGALYLIDPSDPNPSSSASLVISGPPLATPSGIIFTSDGFYLIADRDADSGTGNGAIIKYDPASPGLTFAYTSADFVNPTDIVESSK